MSKILSMFWVNKDRLTRLIEGEGSLLAELGSLAGIGAASGLKGGSAPRRGVSADAAGKAAPFSFAFGLNSGECTVALFVEALLSPCAYEQFK